MSCTDQGLYKFLRNHTGKSVNKKHRLYQDKLSAWASGKAELAALQQRAYEEKIAQELKQKKDFHELQMKYEKSLYEAKLQEVTERLQYEKRKREIELKMLERSLSI